MNENYYNGKYNIIKPNMSLVDETFKIRKQELDNDEIFSGLFWVGQKGVDLGLADDIGHINEIIEKRFGKKAKIKIIEQKKSFLQRKLSSKILNTDDLIQNLEEKALWSRYGL